jgi:GNAT superfamily N-acetyltransferase
MQFAVEPLTKEYKYKFLKFLLPSAARLLGLGGCRGLGALSPLGEPLGCLVAWHEDGRAYLRNIFVGSRYRRSKIGSGLIRAWEESARREGVRELHCRFTLPEEEMTPVHNFLRKNGFPEGVFTAENFSLMRYNICCFCRTRFR